MATVFPAPTAVILAAGMGTRLRAVHAEKPKGFVEIDGTAIIARSLALLEAAGVRDIVLVAGWRDDVYRAFLARRFPGVRVLVNRDFATTGSLASLRLGAAAVESDILVVESDLLYEARALPALLAAPSRNTLLASGLTRSGDEVWVYARDHRLAQLSKQPWSGAPRLGELVGLTRLSRELYLEMDRAANSLPAAAHYEDGLNAVCGQHAIDVLRLENLAWCEIDDSAHMQRAKESVWPCIQKADRALTWASQK
ncbi:MAG TPA: NTP transferase domain-containing protein [Opitutaceae bacterium]|nr:NTP transferase domain-containing protein [Opitutaceae bacterium]